MKPKITKGEWKPVNFNMEEVVCSSTNNELATVHSVWNSEDGLYETKGNASLMAAAPEMYEALDTAVRALAYLVYKADGETERKESASLNIDGKSGEQIVNRIYNIFDKVNGR